MSRRLACSGCGSTTLEVFLDLGRTPLADAFTSDPLLLEDYYSLELAVCRKCFLVQLMEIVDDEVLFNKDYTFYSSASAPIRQYHAAYAWEMINRFEQGKHLTIEIACNDGSLLHHFHDRGWRTLGIDPASGPLAAAQERGIDTINAPFDYHLADQIKGEWGTAGLIIANNVLAHVRDPGDFIRGMALLLAPGGVVVVEVQYLADLITGNMFDHIYHEHRYYFSLSVLRELFQANGLTITGVRHTEPQGGSLRVIAVRDGVTPYRQLSSEDWLKDMRTYESFAGRIQHIRDRLLRMLYIDQSWDVVAGYGATAKSTTLLNYCAIGSDRIQYIVDTTPAKIGKYTPGTGIPIISPEEENARGYPDAYLLLAWNYLGSILRGSDFKEHHSSQWLVPIPIPVIL